MYVCMYVCMYVYMYGYMYIQFYYTAYGLGMSGHAGCISLPVWSIVVPLLDPCAVYFMGHHYLVRGVQQVFRGPNNCQYYGPTFLIQA